MKLEVPFIQLPLTFDAALLQAEIDSLGESVWRPHPQGYAGNSALPLIAVDGDPSSDSISGPMRPTAHLKACPYLRQVLASLGATWGRSRLMRLSGHSEVPRHSDLAYYWRDRVRVHVPIQTQPSVRFQCGDDEVNMAAGECWIFDTWRPHRVVNANPDQRIHLVADTVGSERFWSLVSQGRVPGAQDGTFATRHVAFAPTRQAELEFESVNLGHVMSPWELREHLQFIIDEAEPAPQLDAVRLLCDRFNRTWIGLWARFGEAEAGWPGYRAALDSFAAEMHGLASHLMLTNKARFFGAFRAMIVQAALTDSRQGGLIVKGDYDPDAFAEPAKAVDPARVVPAAAGRTQPDPRFDRPVIILSSPRSGSTLLFETLAKARDVYTVGGESHIQIEGIAELHPSSRQFDSNALAPVDASDMVTSRLRTRFDSALRDRDGKAPPPGRIRLLEKTPKNALRVPFLRKIFSEAHFIYLHRDPREVLSSMIEAWTSGQFRTYPRLPGWTGQPWSLLLVPGWRELAGLPLPELIARQWEITTRTLLDELEQVPAERVQRVDYTAFVADPQGESRRLCSALGLEFDLDLGKTLPNSVHTLSAPAAEKWRRHETEILTVLPLIERTMTRAEQFMRGARR